MISHYFDDGFVSKKVFISPAPVRFVARKAGSWMMLLEPGGLSFQRTGPVYWVCVCEIAKARRGDDLWFEPYGHHWAWNSPVGSLLYSWETIWRPFILDCISWYCLPYFITELCDCGCCMRLWFRGWATFQYPIRRLIVRSREVSKLWDW